MISHFFFLAKRPLKPPILKALPIVIENTQNVTSLKIFAKQSNSFRNSTLNITIQDIPENVTVSAGKKNSGNLKGRRRRDLNVMLLNENDLQEFTLNIPQSVGSFN